MTTKQAARSRAKKAQRRKQSVAAKRTLARSTAKPAEDLDEGFDDFEITDDDYLPSGQVMASAALLWCARAAVAWSNQWSGDGFHSVMQIAQVGWNLEVLGDSDAGRELLEKTRAMMGGAGDPETLQVFDTMLLLVRTAKRARFADDRRLFIEVNVEHRPEGPHVTVKSAEMPTEGGSATTA